MKHYQLKKMVYENQRPIKISVTLNSLQYTKYKPFFQLKNAEIVHYISTRINESAMLIFEA